MARIQDSYECDCENCSGNIPSNENEMILGGVICHCGCHKRETLEEKRKYKEWKDNFHKKIKEKFDNAAENEDEKPAKLMSTYTKNDVKIIQIALERCQLQSNESVGNSAFERVLRKVKQELEMWEENKLFEDLGFK